METPHNDAVEVATAWGKLVTIVLGLVFMLIPGSRRWLRQQIQQAWRRYRDSRTPALLLAMEQRLTRHVDGIAREQKDLRVQMAEDARRNEEAHEMFTKDQIDTSEKLNGILHRLDDAGVGTRRPHVVEAKPRVDAKAAGA